MKMSEEERATIENNTVSPILYSRFNSKSLSWNSLCVDVILPKGNSVNHMGTVDPAK
jgi:hypothetical protein